MTNTYCQAMIRVCAIAIAVAASFQPHIARAATIAPTLAESPLQGLNPVKPNIMYTMDDSGSMGWDFLPDYVAYVSSSVYHCRDGQCGGATSAPGSGYVFSQYDPPVRSSAYNGVYYDPTVTYSAGKKSDATSLALEKTSPGTWTAVYTNGYLGYPNTPTSTTINLAPTAGTPTAALNTTSGSYPDTIWCMKSTASTTDYKTADTDGSVCRRNGRAYAQVTVSSTTTPAITAGYNYPNNSNPSVTCSGSQKCKFTNKYTVYGYPYYYTISQVQYCSAKDSSGWGTSPCTSQWDPTTYKYVRYGTGALTFDPAAFTRVDITPTGCAVTAGGASTSGTPGACPSGRTYAAEVTNFANWYAFYRTRVQSMQAAAGIAFSALDQNSNVGFHTLWENSSLFANILQFNSTNKLTWFTKLYAVAPNNGTPLPDAMWRIGELYSGNAAATGLPGATDPLDPVTGKCQANYHLLSTDGYWNSALSYTSRGDNDKTVPSLTNLPGQTGLTPGAQFPRPYYEGTTAYSNSLSDLAMYYWIRDIRPTVPDQGKDPTAPWQHVTFYGLAIGAHGTVPYPSGLASITSGALNWPDPTTGGAEAVDDLWHAAVNSRGKYFNAQTSQQLAESVVSSLADFTDQSGTGTGVGLAGAQLSVTNQYAYKTSYLAGLSGDVAKYALNVSTGVLPVDANGNPTSPPVWSAATQLAAQAAGAGWDSNRRIISRNDATNAVVAFRLANLSPAQQSGLNAGWSSVSPQPTAQSVLNYLRGDRSNEGVTATSFRARSNILGDIVYSGAVPVGPPNLPYTDGSNPGYEEFAATYATRASTVYVGANDGMLHAFDDTAANGGKETWAYIPKALYSGSDPNDSAHTASPAFQLGALSYRRGGIPLFSHKFYVNATPRVWDVDLANTNVSNVSGPPTTGNNWRTLLIGGLGAGGRALYALDVTNPVKMTDTEAAVAASGRALWEFTEANLGYVFDQPTLVKTYRYGWVVLVTSGYNNPGGKGYLYVLNPSNGALLKKMALPGDTGSDVSPTGLSTVRAYVLSRKDPYVLQAYSGDLKGNVWRFDLSSANEGNWKVELIAHLTDPNGKAQPITSGVRIEIDQNNNVDRYLFVGTGKLLDQPDLPDTSVINSVYVIKDGARTTPEPAPATPYSRANLNAVNGASIVGFATAPTGRGWYQDASSPVQKVVTDVFADVQVVAYAFSYPSSDPCQSILSATLFARDLTTGNSVLESSAGGTGGAVVASVGIVGGIAGAGLVQAVVTTSVPAPPVQVQVTTLTGQVFSFGVNLSSASGTRHRVSWRLMN